MNRKQSSPPATHLFRVCLYLGAFFWLAFVLGAINLIVLPETGRHSHLQGWMILVVAAVVMAITIDHWAKFLPTIFGGVVLGGLLVTAEGHLPNSSVPFPRLISSAITVVVVGCSLISRPLKKGDLGTTDRLALVGLVVGAVWVAVENTPICILLGFSFGFACLLAAWLHDRRTRNRLEASGRQNLARG